jgi:GntR family transcriptional regulator
MIDKASSIPLYVQLADHIRDMIYTGQLEREGKLPTESHWMTEFDLGRATVRAAVSKLEHEDLVYTKQGVGTFVKKQTVAPGLLPVISLTYILKSIGIITHNQIITKEFIVPDAGLQNEFEQSELSSLFLLKRIRFAKGHPVAIETSYFTAEAANQVERCSTAGSIAEALLADGKIQLSRIRQDIIIRESNAKESALLQLNPNETVLVMARWLYQNGEKVPFSYLEFVMPQTLLTYPFKSHDIKNSNSYFFNLE